MNATQFRVGDKARIRKTDYDLAGRATGSQTLCQGIVTDTATTHIKVHGVDDFVFHEWFAIQSKRINASQME